MERQAQDPILAVISRWRGAEWLIAGGWLAMLLALFLDWTTASCVGVALCSAESVSGAGFSGWAWLTFLGFVAVILLLMVRPLLAGLVRLPQSKVPDASLYLGAGALELLGCVLFRIEFPGVSVGPTSITAGSGWYLAILAAAATVAGGELMRRRLPRSSAQPHRRFNLG